MEFLLGGERTGWVALYEITSRKQPASRRSSALIAPQSSEAQLKFPRKFLIRSRYLSPTGERGDRRLYDMLTSQNFPGLFFSRRNFNGVLHVSLGNGVRGLTANDKANVILSALRARYRGRSRGSLEPCLASKHRVECSTINLGIRNDVTGDYEAFNFYVFVTYRPLRASPN